MATNWQNVNKNYYLGAACCALLLGMIFAYIFLRDETGSPVPDKANATEIQEALNELAAQENSIASLERLGPFPQLQTPTGSQVTSFDALIEPRERTFWSLTKATYEVESNVAEVFSFYATFAQQDNWVIASQDQTQLGSQTQATLTLEPPVDRYPVGSLLKIEVTQYAQSPAVRLSISFQRPGSAEELGLAKWSDWHKDQVPIPSGGQQIGGGASKFGRNTISALHTYENTDAQQLKATIVSSSEQFGFSLNPQTEEAAALTLVNTAGVHVRYTIEVRNNIAFLQTTAEYLS